MGFFNKKNKEGNIATKMMYMSGIEQYNKRANVELSLCNENQNIQIKCKNDVYPPSYIPYSRITNVGVISEKEITEKSKSVGGRAIVGGIFLGPLGAIVGGMSGISDKKITNSRCYMVLNYESTFGELEAITFEPVAGNLNYFSFIEKLRERIKIKEISKEIYL